MENSTLDMTGPVPVAVRIVDQDGVTLGDYDFLGWMTVGQVVLPLMLCRGRAHHVSAVIEYLDGEDYQLVFVEGTVLELEGRILEQVRD